MFTAFSLCCKCFWDLYIDEDIVTLLKLCSLQYLLILIIPFVISFTFLYSLTTLFILLLMRDSVTSFSWIKIGWDLFLMSIELSLLLLSLLSTLLPRLTWTVFHVLSMLLLAMLLSLSISSFDVSISLRTWFSFFKSSLWFSDDLVFSLRYVVLSFSILCNISSIEINGLRMSLTL